MHRHTSFHARAFNCYSSLLLGLLLDLLVAFGVSLCLLVFMLLVMVLLCPTILVAALGVIPHHFQVRRFALQ